MNKDIKMLVDDMQHKHALDIIWTDACLVCGQPSHLVNKYGGFCDEICLKEYKRGLEMITVDSSLKVVASQKLSKEIIKELRELDPDNAEQVIASVKKFKKKLEEDDVESPVQKEEIQ